ncbi:DUF2520 domain-containing protein [Marinovum sp. 2_MG-2023]|uniref:Rossmann-like and DUF2520 domain-containing protein n=1 Tax=unclassified Marinovum TaxID=2647166 RepID=UPI0026E24CBD|nr:MULTISPECIES: DUF2520 domain-containing protein [unclassified Marinovum]MDO6731899.1 DUF2520 domain-containing protein [Marinovum sp. 2_MG-2023]MDO6781151.1 DUF2520 domain-containing protein [Marinovum sp. 1_MG-2023]
MQRIRTVNLIGPGKVGTTLLRRLAGDVDVAVLDIFGRSPERARAAQAFAGVGRVAQSLDQMRPADLWLLTVPDDQIAHVAGQLAQIDRPPAIVAHCSGFHRADILAPLIDGGWCGASAHPVLSFADPASAARQFDGCYCGIEGAAASEIEILFTAMGATCFSIRSEAKEIYHAAAVISNNFTTVLQALAREAWAAADVPDAVVDDLHAALLRGTVDNVLAVGPQAALTGPAARGDNDVVRAQSAAVTDWRPEVGHLYDALSEMAARLKDSGHS